MIEEKGKMRKKVQPDFKKVKLFPSCHILIFLFTGPARAPKVNLVSLEREKIQYIFL